MIIPGKRLILMFTTNYKSVSVRIALALMLIAEVFNVISVQATSLADFGWAKRLGGALYDSSNDIVVDGNGNI